MARRSALGKPTAVDYLAMIGGPIAFLAIAIWGILWLLGPAPPPNPVSKLKGGAVRPSMTQRQVVDAVGEPKSIEPRPDGGVDWVYHRGTAEPYVEEDASVTFNAQGSVVRVSFEKSSPPPAESK